MSGDGFSLYKSLSSLIYFCRAGKRCRYGYYYYFYPVFFSLVPVQVFDRVSLVLSLYASKVRGFGIGFLDVVKSDYSFDVGIPAEIEFCESSPCVDGSSVDPDNVSGFQRFALVYTVSRGLLHGVLFLSKPIDLGGIRWVRRLLHRVRR